MDVFSTYWRFNEFFQKNCITVNDVYCLNFLPTLIFFSRILLVFCFFFFTLFVILSFFFFFTATLRIVFPFKINLFSLFLLFFTSSLLLLLSPASPSVLLSFSSDCTILFLFFVWFFSLA